MKIFIALTFIFLTFGSFASRTAIRHHHDLAELYFNLEQDQTEIEQQIYQECDENVSLRIGTPSQEGSIPITANSFDKKNPVSIVFNENVWSNYEESRKKINIITTIVCQEYEFRKIERETSLYALHQSYMTRRGTGRSILIGQENSYHDQTIGTAVWFYQPGIAYDGPGAEENRLFRTTTFIRHDHNLEESNPKKISLGVSTSAVSMFSGEYQHNKSRYNKAFSVSLDYCVITGVVNFMFDNEDQVTTTGEIRLDAIAIDVMIGHKVTDDIRLITAFSGNGGIMSIISPDGSSKTYAVMDMLGTFGFSFEETVMVNLGVRISTKGAIDSEVVSDSLVVSPCISLTLNLSDSFQVYAKGELPINDGIEKPTFSLGITLSAKKRSDD